MIAVQVADRLGVGAAEVAFGWCTRPDSGGWVCRTITGDRMGPSMVLAISSARRRSRPGVGIQRGAARQITGACQPSPQRTRTSAARGAANRWS